MTKLVGKTICAALCAGVLATISIAAENPGPKTEKVTAKDPTVRSMWPPETLSGKITMVDPAKNLVVVTGPHGVPFDMRVTTATRIRSGDKNLTLQDLNQDQQKAVSIRFVPERSGDIARSIQVTG